MREMSKNGFFLKITCITGVLLSHILFYIFLDTTLKRITNLKFETIGIVSAVVTIFVFCLSIFLAFKL